MPQRGPTANFSATKGMPQQNSFQTAAAQKKSMLGSEGVGALQRPQTATQHQPSLLSKGTNQ